MIVYVLFIFDLVLDTFQKKLIFFETERKSVSEENFNIFLKYKLEM